MSNKPYEDAETVGKCVEKNIWQARVYFSLLSKFLVNLRSTNFYNEYVTIFDYIEDACLTKYILALAKIFDSTKTATLWQLVILAKDLPDNGFKLNLENYQPFLRDSILIKRKDLLSNFSEIEKEIKKIQRKISPLRNTERAHPIPWMSKNKNRITVNTTHEWLDFAEKIFEQCMDILGKGCLRIGNFESKEFESLINNCVESIKAIPNSGDIIPGTLDLIRP